MKTGPIEYLKIGAIPALVLALALFFALPWVPEPSPGGAALERYSPARDGASLLMKTYDADGALISTESQNLATIPSLRSFTELPQGLRKELEELYSSPENMDDARVMEVRRRTLKGSGRVAESTDTLVLEPRGVLLLGSRADAGSTEIVFDPPALMLPADLGPGSRWVRSPTK